jgi:hypothetical protein
LPRNPPRIFDAALPDGARKQGLKVPIVTAPLTRLDRRFDPTAGFSDLQWFMFRQRNIAHYAAFSRRDYDEAVLVGIAGALVALAPQLATAYRGAIAGGVPEAVLRRLVSVERVESFEGFPDAVIESGPGVTADPDLPLFRVRAFVRAGGADAEGRRAFLLVRVSHALVEGADSSLLSRSQSAAHPVSLSSVRTSGPIAALARATGALAALAHLLVANLYVPRPGPFGFASRAYPRAQLTTMARALGVSQRALFFALVMHTLFGAGTGTGKRRISSTYSTIDNGGGARRDTYMRMRMLFAVFANAPDFSRFAQGVERQLHLAASRESGFNAELNAAGVATHRALSRVIGFAYRPQLFAFMPYDIVLGLIPPHRLSGGLTEGLLEPVYCGAATPGANACVIVPGREQVTFNFYIETSLRPNLAQLDALLGSHDVNRGFS